MSWLAPRLAAPGRLGLAIVGSIALSAHLVFWVSVVIGALGDGHGYGRPAIFVAAALLALPGGRSARHAAAGRRRPGRGGRSCATARRSCWQGSPAVSWPSSWPRALARDPGRDLGRRLELERPGRPPLHRPVASTRATSRHRCRTSPACRSSTTGSPTSTPPSPRARRASSRSRPSSSRSAIRAGALALCVHGLARALVARDQGAAVALLAVVLVVFAGGLGWMRLIERPRGRRQPGRPRDAQQLRQLLVRQRRRGQLALLPHPIGDGHRAPRPPRDALGLPMLVGAMLLLTLGMPTRPASVRRDWRDRPAPRPRRRRAHRAAGAVSLLLLPRRARARAALGPHRRATRRSRRARQRVAPARAARARHPVRPPGAHAGGWQRRAGLGSRLGVRARDRTDWRRCRSST